MTRLKLHEQARRRIERLIADRGIRSGTRIPTESELATELKVSRTTIRSALKVLEQEGKIERTPGRGTILRQPRLGQLLGKLLSFSEEMKLRGLTPSNRLVEITQMMPSAPVRALLRLDGESVLETPAGSLRQRRADRYRNLQSSLVGAKRTGGGRSWQRLVVRFTGSARASPRPQ